MYQWVNDVAEAGSQALSDVGTYISENEWAANALAGGAVAAGNYLLQKDQQEYERRQSDKAWERKTSLAQAPDLDMEKYDWSDLSTGSMTNGGLIAGGIKKK